MPPATDIYSLRQDFARRFPAVRGNVSVVVSPYRICPLGAHIDHQLGPVTALAIDRGVLLAFAPSGSREVMLESLNFPGKVRFTIDEVPAATAGDWGNYARGAVRALQATHPLRQGMVGLSSGSLSEGGLSSSAAFGVACLLALEAVNSLAVSPEDNIVFDQQIENDYLGLRNGILDQAAILFSRRNHLTRIDCATHRHQLISPGGGLPSYTILLAFSGLRKSLVSTAYNRRVEECATAAKLLLAAAGRSTRETDTAEVLGQVSAAEYATHRHVLTGAPARRAEHFFSEVARVDTGVTAWQRGDLAEFGRLMTASGYSSIVNYECGAPPLVDLYELLIATPGVFGARFSGAGFRGCCVALVETAAAEEIAARIERDYRARQPELAEQAGVLLCDSDDGARIFACE